MAYLVTAAVAGYSNSTWLQQHLVAVAVPGYSNSTTVFLLGGGGDLCFWLQGKQIRVGRS